MIGSSDSLDWLSDCLVSWLSNWFGKEWNLGFGFVWDWSLAACLSVCRSVCRSGFGMGGLDFTGGVPKSRKDDTKEHNASDCYCETIFPSSSASLLFSPGPRMTGWWRP